MLVLPESFQPKGKYVLMESLEPEKITPGGVIIPDFNRIQKPIGKILKIGNKVTEIKEGDTFFHVHFFGIKCEYLEKTCYIMQAHEVIGKL
jgi:co-chaperonin GroES (HSP10)